jgi:hypothetical protein
MQSITAEAADCLGFGGLIDGRAEYLVTCDMLGLQALFYDRQQREYVLAPRRFLWTLKLSACRNPSAGEHLPLPPGCSPDTLAGSGLDSLGYLAAILETRELAEYADNPGLLALLIAERDRIDSLLARRPDRIELLRRISNNPGISGFHLKWLRKVQVSAAEPALVAEKLRRSLLRMQAADARSPGNTHRARLFKLFAHQESWTLRGLDFAAELLGSPQACSDDGRCRLECLNGNEPAMISGTRAALLAFAKFARHDGRVPALAASRARRLAKQNAVIAPGFARRFRRYAARITFESSSSVMDCAAVLLTDRDIPSPVLPGHGRVKSLDTLGKIRTQAKLAGNCLWTAGIIDQVVGRKIDLYAVEGDNRYTFSVNRETREIRTLEAAKGTLIKPSDLGLIADWFNHASGSRGSPGSADPGG